MEVGTSVWVRDTEEAWMSGCISKKTEVKGGVQVTVVKDTSKEEKACLVPGVEQETDELKYRNTTMEDSTVEDLITLHYLNEPSILDCLQKRYFMNKIYTYTGPILIAMNPFQSLAIYDHDRLEEYFNFGLVKSQGLVEHLCVEALPPHIFAVSDNAYRNMMSVLQNDPIGVRKSALPSAGQSILISGESGAGKTESTKILLKYLTTVALDASDFATTGTYMDKVMQSNPILEAFGNARTVRNDNSSRFGKFVEIHFNKNGSLIGGKISTYLLEKVRLCFQQAGERNYHIFYQMAAGGSAAEKKRWGIASIDQIDYCNQGKIFKLEHINDAMEFSNTKAAFTTLDFDSSSQAMALDITAGLMHLGQIKFAPDEDGEGSELSKDISTQTSLNSAVSLLGLPKEALQRVMIERVTNTGKETFVKKFKPAQAADARDALAKTIYSRLFDWLVSTINVQLKPDAPDDVRAEIGVLDIFGFECFQNNSFEQLCINYTNETLQQQFNKFVFELEQEEYRIEAIEWSALDFPNNQDCLDLIETKKTGLFAMIDDECLVPKGSDANLAKRMYQDLIKFPRFVATNVQKTNNLFQINHYAGPVVYSTLKFVEKNKDEVPKEASELLNKSSCSLLKLLFVAPLVETTAGRSGPNPSVCFQFKAQLAYLMSRIHLTKPHYVRCIKPNDLSRPQLLQRNRVVEQLRCGGVLEAVKVSRSGFPYRLSHQEFFERYRAQANPFSAQCSKLPWNLRNQPKPAQLCQMLIPSLWDDASAPKQEGNASTAKSYRFMLKWKGKTTTSGITRDLIQIGKSKIFFRKAPYDLLEGRRARLTFLSAAKIQAACRGFMVRVVQIKVGRRQNRAATKIQARFRAHYYSKRLNTVRLGVIFFQATVRGYEIRANLRKILEQDERYMAKRRGSHSTKRAKRKQAVVRDEKTFAEKQEKLKAIKEQKDKKAGKLSRLFNTFSDEKMEKYRSRMPKVWSQDRILRLFGINNVRK